MSTMVTRRNVLGTLAAAACARRGAWGAERSLYAVTASTDPYIGLKFPSVLARIASESAEILWTAQLMTADKGVDWALYSLEGRAVVLAAQQYIVGDFTVLLFDSPGKPRALRVDLGGMSAVGRHLVWFEGRLHLALSLYHDGKRRLLGIRLDDLAVEEFQPVQLYRDFAIDGEAGGLIPNPDRAYLEQPEGSRRLMFAEWPRRFPSPFILPAGSSFAFRDLPELSAVNREIAVVTSRDTRVWDGMNGFTPVRLFDRQRETWHTIEAPGAQSAFRAFGVWVATHVRYNLKPKPQRGVPEVREDAPPLKLSPGADSRRQGFSTTGPSFDSRAGNLQVYQPGLIWLYHVPTRRRIVEETGQGDTEVLWVEDGHVLYRCDRALYEARIDGTRLRNHRKLIERDFIADVHWVFYGPPSPPPPDPPWAAFKDYEK